MSGLSALLPAMLATAVGPTQVGDAFAGPTVVLAFAQVVAPPIGGVVVYHSAHGSTLLFTAAAVGVLQTKYRDLAKTLRAELADAPLQERLQAVTRAPHATRCSATRVTRPTPCTCWSTAIWPGRVASLTVISSNPKSA